MLPNKGDCHRSSVEGGGPEAADRSPGPALYLTNSSGESVYQHTNTEGSIPCGPPVARALVGGAETRSQESREGLLSSTRAARQVRSWLFAQLARRPCGMGGILPAPEVCPPGTRESVNVTLFGIRTLFADVVKDLETSSS